MDLIWQGILAALRLLVTWDPEIVRITLLTLKISGLATAISLVAGVPLGAGLALTQFPGRRLVVSVINAGMGLPPVVVGLFITILLWRSGPFGSLRLLFTPPAMVLAQVVIATPLVAGLTLSALQGLDPRLRLQVASLGASPLQLVAVLLWEARLGVLAAVIAGFGGVVSEVGASMMVGGNITDSTRVLTTAIVLEVGKGEFDIAIALSLILMALAYGVTVFLTVLQQRRSEQ